MKSKFVVGERVGGLEGKIVKRHKENDRSHGNVPYLDICVKTDLIVCFKYVWFILHQLYFKHL